jgi:preprotein translocase subunit SecA
MAEQLARGAAAVAAGAGRAAAPGGGGAGAPVAKGLVETAGTKAMAEQIRFRGAAPRSSPGGPGAKLGRNDPCWCGSGQKFKRCHGR